MSVSAAITEVEIPMKKKAIGILMSLALVLTFMMGAASTALAADPNVRVKINIGTTTQFSFVVCGGSYTANGIALANGATYTVKLENGNSVNLYDSNNQLICPVGSPDALMISSAAEMETVRLTHPTNGERDYLGELWFTISGGSLQLVNHLNIEKYLYGVVPYEMSDSFPIEALKAQAVAARTYAANRMKGATGAYDLVDNTDDQVYKGYDSTKTNAIAAVDGTKAQVLKYGDTAYVQCYYSASNGGWTDITQHRWSTSEPLKSYNVIKEDPYDIANPSSKQERLVLPRTVTAENPLQYQNWASGSYVSNDNSPTGIANASRYLRLSALPAVAAKGYVANVTDDLEILGFSNIVAHTYDGKHGGANGYNGNDVTGKNDCKDMLKADVTMTVLASRYETPQGGGYLLGDVDMNGSISISDYTLVRLHILGIKGLSGEALTIADADRNGSISISDYTLIRLHILGLKAITGRTNDGLVREPVEVTFTIDFPVMDVGGAYPSFFDGSLGLFLVQSDDANWYIYQRRYGHGIGMSQRGAQQQANEGRTYTQIIEFYYPNYPGYPAVTWASLY